MSTTRLAVATLGLPQSDTRYRLRTAGDAHRVGCIDDAAFADIGRALRLADWRRLASLGVTRIPSNEAHRADRWAVTAAMVGLAATSTPGADRGGPAPRLDRRREFVLASKRPIAEFLEAAMVGLPTRPVLLGPVSFLAAAAAADFDPIELLPRALPVWSQVLRHLRRAGAEWVQIDEPRLTGNRDPRLLAAAEWTYATFAHDRHGPRIMLVPGGGDLAPALTDLLELPVDGLHLDLVRAPDLLERATDEARDGLVLSLGVVDGRGDRAADLPRLRDRLESVVAHRGPAALELAPAGALHLPHGVAAARIGELDRLAAAFTGDRSEIGDEPLPETLPTALPGRTVRRSVPSAVAAE
jgi:5-methyltetrahydropteroyltriglutamate--homocysteine methyltransferase